MNTFIQAVTALDVSRTKQLLESEEKWRLWSQPDGKNALHFLCGTPLVSKWNVPADDLEQPDPKKADASLAILKLLLKHGLGINSIHRIPDKTCGFFPATPVWYSYTRGRNNKLYTWLLQHGGSPDHCLFAITWYDDVNAANLFKKHGALKGSPPYEGGVDAVSADGVVLYEARKKLISECLLASLSWKKFRMADWLVKNGADPNLTDPRGDTALIYSVKKKFPLDVIKMLLQNGADPDRRNAKGESARAIAARYRDRSIFELIDRAP